ncbi:phage tail protein [Aquimarina rubra]|uniref:Phage tail protein n=1 Tax=Aquimarina rubra TaxID=1920033 RepID=A0ABW5LNB5_9FLAO|nr:phage tail protein [uncultured Aquimarina sp.]
MAEYPLPKFHFKVTIGGDTELNCTEVSGLDFETEVIEYRGGADNDYFKKKQPGMTKFANISIKRGTFASTKGQFYDMWKKNVFFQEGEEQYRSDLTISLLDEKHEPIVTWEAADAWLLKIQSTDLKADGNEIAIESAEFVINSLKLAS